MWSWFRSPRASQFHFLPHGVAVGYFRRRLLSVIRKYDVTIVGACKYDSIKKLPTLKFGLTAPYCHHVDESGITSALHTINLRLSCLRITSEHLIWNVFLVKLTFRSFRLNVLWPTHQYWNLLCRLSPAFLVFNVRAKWSQNRSLWDTDIMKMHLEGQYLGGTRDDGGWLSASKQAVHRWSSHSLHLLPAGYKSVYFCRADVFSESEVCLWTCIQSLFFLIVCL